jgi:hypothetical protein
MPESDIEERADVAVRAAAVEQIPEDMVSLDWRTALNQIAGLAAFRAELPDLTGFKRGLQEFDIRMRGLSLCHCVVNIGALCDRRAFRTVRICSSTR